MRFKEDVRGLEAGPPKNHKAGLVGPALCVELVRSILFRPPAQNVKILSLSHPTAKPEIPIQVKTHR
jgi:hypothetical protein